MKQKLKRFMAGFMAMLTLVGTLFTNGTTAFAASPQANIAFWNASVKNSGEVSELKPGYNHGKILYSILDGNSAYCMNFGLRADGGQLMNSYDDASTSMSAQQRKLLSYCLYYGFNSTQKAAPSNSQCDEYIATQAMVWVIVADIFGTGSGLRISELCGLTPADLNFEKRFVNVDHQLLRSTEDGYYIEAPKTESGFRQVPMSAAAYEAFERVLKKRRDGRCIEVDGYKDFLFLNRDGLPKTAVNYDAMFKCLAKKYNKCHKEPLPDVMTPHTMRHTFCTRMANAGMNPKALQYIMGHANIVMTLNYYAHATFHSAQEEMERLQAKAKTTVEAKPEPAAESAEETKAA